MYHLCQKGNQTAADSSYLMTVKIGREWGFKVYIVLVWELIIIVKLCEITYMISCKTDAAGIDCRSEWQVLKRPQVRK